MKVSESEKKELNDWMTLANVLKVSSGIHVLIDDQPIFIEELSKGMAIWKSIDFWMYVVQLDLETEVNKKKHSKASNQTSVEILFTMLPSIIFQMISLGVDEKTLGIFTKRLAQKYDLNQDKINHLENICSQCITRNSSKEEKEKNINELLSNSNINSPNPSLSATTNPLPRKTKTKFTFKKKKDKGHITYSSLEN